MVHSVLEKAGNIRDLKECGYELTLEEVMNVIPSEIEFQDLKELTKITSWYDYFVPVMKQCAQYEQDLAAEHGGIRQIWRENKLQLSSIQMCNVFSQFGNKNFVRDAFTGIVDLIILCNDGTVIIVDYKTGNKPKDQNDFDMNSQLYLYVLVATIFCKQEGIELNFEKCKLAYIDIPRLPTALPRVLPSGKISVAKDQNCFGDNYAAAVAISLGYDDETPVEQIPELNEGGSYYECYRAMCMNKAAYLSDRMLDIDTYLAIIPEVFDTIVEIESKGTDKRNFLTRFDAWTCVGCDFLSSCKTWCKPQMEKL
jgi:hypothetical protein